MSNRRDILKQICALGVGVTAPLIQTACSMAASPHKSSAGVRIRSASRRDDTILKLGGIGDGYKMSWNAAGSQYVVVNDGPGWATPPENFYNTRLWTIDGAPEAAAFHDVNGYPELNRAARPDNATHYYGHGVLAVKGRVYHFSSTLDQAEDHPRHWTGSKLIYSDDNGVTWRNQNGSTPVVWEDWKEQSRDSLAFFNEPDGCFSMLSILQMGQDYSANRDGYIYVYGLNGNVDGLMNQLVMYRVAIAKMLDRTSYEFFAGFGRDGPAQWSKDIAARKPVHEFPRGYVNYKNLFPGDLVVETWLPSVVYNEPLGLYMMASAGIRPDDDGTEYGKASYLGFWVSETPWGPWRQVHKEAAWTPGGDPAARAYSPQISPKWIAADGKSFWLVWTDIKGIREFGRDEALMEAAMAKAKTVAERAAVDVDFISRYMPGFSFSAQRVDLTVD